MVTGSSYADNEKKRWMSRIVAITFRIAKDLPPGTISRAWVTKTSQLRNGHQTREPP